MRRGRYAAIAEPAPAADFEAATSDLLPELLDDSVFRSGYFAAVPRDIVQYILKPLVYTRKSIAYMREVAAFGTILASDVANALQAPCNADNLEFLKSSGCVMRCPRWVELRALYVRDLVIVYGWNTLKIMRGGETQMETRQYQISSGNYIGMGLLCFGISGTLQTRALYVDLDTPDYVMRMETDYPSMSQLCVLPCGLALFPYSRTLLNARTGRSIKVDCEAMRNLQHVNGGTKHNCIDDYGTTADITSVYLNSPANVFLRDPLSNAKHGHM